MTDMTNIDWATLWEIFIHKLIWSPCSEGQMKRLKEYIKNRNTSDSILRLFLEGHESRVARWFVFKPKIQIWAKLQSFAMEDVGMDTWSTIWSFVIFYGHLV
jgi:hypothetical protein